jgi:hypothetical protein
VVRGFEANLKWKVDLDCTLTHPCITPICDQRIYGLNDAQTIVFGGWCSILHCPGLTMESELQIFASSYDKDSENTSVFLALIESDYCRLWDEKVMG